MTTGALIRENINWGLAYNFRDLVHYHHGMVRGGRHGSPGSHGTKQVIESYILICGQ